MRTFDMHLLRAVRGRFDVCTATSGSDPNLRIVGPVSPNKGEGAMSTILRSMERNGRKKRLGAMVVGKYAG